MEASEGARAATGVPSTSTTPGSSVATPAPLSSSSVATWLESLLSSNAVDHAASTTALAQDQNLAQNRRLAVGAAIVEELRAAVYRETGFRCSAGIASNKAS